jgi:hypothetical protein
MQSVLLEGVVDLICPCLALDGGNGARPKTKMQPQVEATASAKSTDAPTSPVIAPAHGVFAL